MSEWKGRRETYVRSILNLNLYCWLLEVARKLLFVLCVCWLSEFPEIIWKINVKISSLPALPPKAAVSKNYIKISPQYSFFNKDFIYLFLDREEVREREMERNINVWLPLACPPQGTWHPTQACALTGNQTSDPLFHRPTLNPLSHSSQSFFVFNLRVYRSNFSLLALLSLPLVNIFKKGVVR